MLMYKESPVFYIRLQSSTQRAVTGHTATAAPGHEKELEVPGTE